MDETPTHDMPWKEAIALVLREAGEPMHYSDITEEIASRGLRTSFGATPASTVNAQMSTDIQQKGADSQFARVGRGTYTLRSLLNQEPVSTTTPLPPGTGEDLSTEEEPAGVINAFGMFWRRTAVDWTSTPKLWGQQQRGADPVDFGGQRGVYLLHDGYRTVYVGRASDQPLGRRLYQHTFDRLEGRWDRWSWFGLLEVTDEGDLREPTGTAPDSSVLISTMEALLIESLEPAQNRRRGDDFAAVEYLQAEDPDLKRKKLEQIVGRLQEELKL